MKETSNITVNINTKQEQQKAADVPALCKKADIAIHNQDDYNTASDVLKEVKSRYKELDTQRKNITKPLDDAKKAVMELFRQPLDLLGKAESKIKSLMIGYTAEQEKKAREEQEKLQKLAEAEAERERKKLEAKIERAKASGKEEKVEELEMQKEAIIPMDVPVVTANIEQPKGISYKEKWTAEVVDFKALPDEYKLPNQQALDKVAQATKGSLSIPGVKFNMEKVSSVRV